jgi:hypothetical protein
MRDWHAIIETLESVPVVELAGKYQHYLLLSSSPTSHGIERIGTSRPDSNLPGETLNKSPELRILPR